MLEYARELGVLARRGGVSVDGTKVGANASKHAAVSHGRAVEMIAELEREVQTLMALAEQAAVDTGYFSEAAVAAVESDGGPTAYVAVEKTGHHRTVADLLAPPEPVRSCFDARKKTLPAAMRLASPSFSSSKNFAFLNHGPGR